MAFYQKYRPQNFDDLVGQPKIVKILLEALKGGRTTHGYLFAGPRGLGKTTTARLLAKALNCSKQDGLICDQCQSCLEIAAGRSLDVIEIDAASNRGIDEIRELREKIKFVPTASRYKVFIIDEVHMLTKEAFNALLKTLEEPPKHAVFVLATTEPHKVPATILSRVQRFDFAKPQADELARFLEGIAKQEKIDLVKDAALALAQLAEGSYRDALTLLEQVSLYQGTINAQTVAHLLGLPEDQSIELLLDSLTNGQSVQAFTTIKSLYDEGVDFGYVYKQLVLEARQRLINTGDNRFAQLLSKLIVAAADSRLSPLPQIPLEILATEENESQELRIKNKESSEQKSIIHDSKPARPAGGFEIRDDKWQEITEKIKQYNHSLAGILRQGRPMQVAQDRLTIAVRFSFHKDRIEDPKNHLKLAQIIQETLGRPVKIVCMVDDGLEPQIAQEVLFEQALEVFGSEQSPQSPQSTD